MTTRTIQDAFSKFVAHVDETLRTQAEYFRGRQQGALQRAKTLESQLRAMIDEYHRAIAPIAVCQTNEFVELPCGCLCDHVPADDGSLRRVPTTIHFLTCREGHDHPDNRTDFALRQLSVVAAYVLSRDWIQ